MPDLSFYFDKRTALGALIGFLFSSVIAFLRARIRLLEYSVSHLRIGVSAEDVTFGNVSVTWRGMPVANLFLSTVTVENNTSRDYTDLQFKVYTDSATSLLTERPQIVGSTYTPAYTPDFLRIIEVRAGETATAEQTQIFTHRREYSIPVLNRGQRIELIYLSNVNVPNRDPGVFMDMLQEGVILRLQSNEPRVHGVPTKRALQIGLLVCLAAVVILGLWPLNSWVAPMVAVGVGLYAQIIGALLYRFGRTIGQVLVR